MEKEQGQAPISSYSWQWYGSLGVLVSAGVVGGIYRAWQGLAVTHLSSYTPWGLWVALYIYFVGLSAGAFLLSSLVYVFGQERFERIGRQALWVAVVSMVVALTFILLDLGHMERFWVSLRFWKLTSVLSWEVHFYIVYVVLLLTELYHSMRRDLVLRRQAPGIRGLLARYLTWQDEEISPAAQARDRQHLRRLGMIGIPLAVLGVHGGTGTLFAVVKARPYWNTAVFPIIFVLSALVSGTALLLVGYVLERRRRRLSADLDMVQGLARLMATFILLDLGLEFYEILIPAYSLRSEEMASLKTLFLGSLAPYFWIGQIWLGNITPLILVFSSRTGRSLRALTWAGILVVLGIVAVRINIVLPPLLQPVLPGLPAGAYFPSPVEVITSVGVIALGLLLYTLGNSLLPLEVSEADHKVTDPTRLPDSFPTKAAAIEGVGHGE
ncbi:MAG: polysulfide reductase NrfD [Firmicutes bacterium]|nr:polysulfide reductase NrfD [Bacillota bacterium]MCL5038731.1 polysulfide reductase NrfD [Bacillota bacterium]